MKKVLALTLCFFLLLGLISCRDGDAAGTDTATDTAETEKFYPHAGMALSDPDAILVRTAANEYPVSLFRYLFMDQYMLFLNNNYYYLSYLGLNPDAPLHDQVMYGAEDGETWYGYFLAKAKHAFAQFVALKEEAERNGFALNEDDMADIEAFLDEIAQSADEGGVSFEAYLEDYFGKDMTRERVKKAIETVQLAYRYFDKLTQELTYTEEQLEAEYRDHLTDHGRVDFYEAVLKSDDSATAEEKAERMKALIEGGASFMEAYGQVVPEEDRKNEDELLVTGVTGGDSAESAFLFAEGRKAGDVTVVNEEGEAAVVMCLRSPYRVEGTTVTVRHILLDSETYKEEEKADEVYRRILDADDPLAEFLKLVPDYSTDTASVPDGGLYQNVRPGDTVEGFNDWCFDASRAPGDFGLVKSTYGYHILYFVGSGQEIWAYECESALRSADSEALLEAAVGATAFTYDEALLDGIAA